jgi:hypothetical protein
MRPQRQNWVIPIDAEVQEFTVQSGDNLSPSWLTLALPCAHGSAPEARTSLKIAVTTRNGMALLYKHRTRFRKGSGPRQSHRRMRCLRFRKGRRPRERAGQREILLDHRDGGDEEVSRGMSAFGSVLRATPRADAASTSRRQVRTDVGSRDGECARAQAQHPSKEHRTVPIGTACKRIPSKPKPTDER